MQSVEFASAYDRERAAPFRFSGELGEAMEPAIRWSRVFGHILYDRLRNPDGPPISYLDQAGYSDWMNNGLIDLEDYLVNQDTPESHRADIELNFHRLNGPMTTQWNIIMNGHWKPLPAEKNLPRLDQKGAIRANQDNLALIALDRYREREMTAGPKANFSWFDKDKSDQRWTAEGILNELDAGVVLLGMLYKHPDLTVVPAPMQFEHSASHAINADFIVYHASGRAVGVQVKGSVLQSEAATNYDPERIVLVDARVDFGNELAKRTQQKSSNIEQVSWGGIICANHVKRIQPDGYLAQRLIKTNVITRSQLLNAQMAAKRYTQAVKPQNHLAVERISQRVLPRVLPVAA